jgi:hypothetical protein
MRKLAVILTLGLVAAGLAAYFVRNSLSATSVQWPSSGELARAYVHLSAPRGPAAVSEARAEAWAARHMGATAVAAQLRYCVDTSMVPVLRRDCWVVLLDHSKSQFATAPGNKSKTLFLLDLVDAHTGKGIEWLHGS